MIDPAMTGTFELQLPKDLLAHAKLARADKSRGKELKVEGWHGNWLTRLVERLIGQD